jgi:hypothetical protein
MLLKLPNRSEKKGHENEEQQTNPWVLGLAAWRRLGQRWR